jgi:hypothetical protein
MFADMNKHFYLIFLLALVIEPNFSVAQFQIKSIWISSEHVVVEQKKIWSDNRPSESDTIQAAPFIGNDVNMSFQGDMITSTYRKSDNQFNDDVEITIKIDTVKRIFTNIIASITTDVYELGTQTSYPTYSRYIDCGPLEYRISKNGDSLIGYIKGQELNGIIRKTAEAKDTTTPFLKSSTSFVKILDIPDSAYLSVVILGNFVHSIVLFKHQSEASLLNMVSKMITIKPKQIAEKNESTNCYDLLGRKHALEFLGADGTANTYSVRMLPAGVYFVNDGKEMVKFLVAQ